MKINILNIVFDHFRTLYNAKSGRFSIMDLFCFYFLPIIISIFVWHIGVNINKEIYSLSITFFGIFIALLLYIQVAIFSIYLRKRDKVGDKIIDNEKENELEERRVILLEINSNISYLLVFSCFSLSVYFVFYMFEFFEVISVIFCTFSYGHFILTFLMIIKRAHALFMKEYSDGINY